MIYYPIAKCLEGNGCMHLSSFLLFAQNLSSYTESSLSAVTSAINYASADPWVQRLCLLRMTYDWIRNILLLCFWVRKHIAARSLGLNLLCVRWKCEAVRFLYVFSVDSKLGYWEQNANFENTSEIYIDKNKMVIPKEGIDEHSWRCLIFMIKHKI